MGSRCFASFARRVGLLVFVALVARVGFLSAGYGTDPDAHRLAIAARQIRETGRYAMSREPGHPVQEYVSALTITWGPVGINALTAAMSCLAVGFFASALARLKVDRPILVAVGFGFSPLFLVHSVDAMDFAWALAFSWAGVYLSLRGWALGAGVALGLAIGCRVTEALTGFPILVLFGLGANRRGNWREYVKVILAASVVTVGVYVPVFLRYGRQALRVYESDRPTLGVVLSRMFVEVWGWPGLVGLLVVGVFAIVGFVCAPDKPTAGSESLRQRRNRILIALVVPVIGTLVVFLRLPHDAGYLLPIVPWLLVLVGVTLPAAAVWALAVSLMLSNVPVRGLGDVAIWGAHQRRVSQVRTVRRLVAQLRTQTGPTLLVAGTYQPKIQSALAGEALNHVEVVYLLSAAQAELSRQRGTSLLYLRRASAQNLRVMGVDLQQSGGRALEL